jgi:hypothetical protein
MSYSPRLVVLEGKHPAEVVDYALDFAGWLVGAETLATLTSCTATTGLTVAGSPTAPAISGDTVVFWLSGGTSGTTYRVEVVVVTSGGRTLVADAEITVTDPTQ